ncbi:MAG: hypothetical protein Q4B64_04295 [Spirochaetales bacterium]|nr:hypothetical protein [Spirochaetales bacterium]
MKTKNTRKIILMSLMAIIIFGFTSCRLIEDSISSSDNAYWESVNRDKFTVTFSERTRDRKNISIHIHVKKGNSKCTYHESYSLTNSTTYRLSRRIHDGEYVEIFWLDSLHRETLYGDN